MRGGNRNVALIVLEGAALAFLAALYVGVGRPRMRLSLRTALLFLLLSSPVWLGLVYLFPIPADVGHPRPVAPSIPMYGEGGVTPGASLPLSLEPDATVVSLLAGIPLVARSSQGTGCTPTVATRADGFVGLAFIEVLMGFCKSRGNRFESVLRWHAGAALRTFANPNH
jgi:hypothetical protein